MMTREDKRMVIFHFIFFKTNFSGHTLKKIAHSLFDAWSFLLVHICFTPSEGTKDLCKLFSLRNWTMEVEQ